MHFLERKKKMNKIVVDAKQPQKLDIFGCIHGKMQKKTLSVKCDIYYIYFGAVKKFNLIFQET